MSLHEDKPRRLLQRAAGPTSDRRPDVRSSEAHALHYNFSILEEKMNELHTTKDNKPPDLPNSAKYDTIRDEEHSALLEEAISLLRQMTQAQFKKIMEGL